MEIQVTLVGFFDDLQISKPENKRNSYINAFDNNSVTEKMEGQSEE